MVNKKTVLALGATFLVGAISLDALAGSQLRLDDSRNMEVEGSQAPAITYGYSSSLGSFVADVNLDGFLLCNYFAGSTPNTDGTIYLLPRHGTWQFGSSVPGVTESFQGLYSVGYDNASLSLVTCSNADANPDCGGAALQCYVADEKGLGVADTRTFFHDGFDWATNVQETHVAITNVQVPSNPATEFFTYDVVVYVPASGQAVSSPVPKYLLKHGYDTSVFSTCDSVTKVIGQADVKHVTCTMRPNAVVSNDIPVVSAALFTRPDVSETDYSDNVAFGYPVELN